MADTFGGPKGPVNPTPTGGYKEKVNDEQLINLIEAGVQNSVGDWLNSSDLTRERLRSTYEFAGVPEFHLAPQGVSTICLLYTSDAADDSLRVDLGGRRII